MLREESCAPGRQAAIALIATALAVYGSGLALLFTNGPRFIDWIREDGPVEWLTFVMLAGSSAWALLVRSSGGAEPGAWRRALIWSCIASLCAFAALEEISYGQRILGFETPEFLLLPAAPGPLPALYNRQAETNLHNLVVRGINVNKVVFGQLLAGAMVVYFVLLPILYQLRPRFAQAVDRWGLPVARNYQIVIFVLVTLLSKGLKPSSGTGKFFEMQELVGVAFFLAVITHPRNALLQPAVSAAWLRLRPGLLFFGRPNVRLRLLVTVVGLQLALGTVLRIAFLQAFRSTAESLNPAEVSRALVLGARFDLRLALLLCLPFAALSWLPALNPDRSRRARRAWWTYFVAVEGLILFVYAFDFGHYDYLHARLDAGAIDHVLSAGIALGMVWETYPVIPGLLGLGLIATAHAIVLWRLALTRSPTPARSRSRGQRVVLGVVLTLAYGLGIYGKWSWYPLRWSDAFSGTNRFLSALALNPVLFLFDTVANRIEPYDPDEIPANYDEIAALLELDSPDPDRRSLARPVDPRERPPFAPNLVLIHLEAFAGHKTSALGNPLPSSPQLDRIAQESLLFTHFFVPTSPTARSVFTMLTGIPDVNPIRSASRNPRLVDQHTLVNALEGYERFYFLGGSATWANIRGLLAHNIQGLQIFEEGDYDAPRINVWGVSDLELFAKAHEVLGSQNEPFFAFIQTAGNHGPYTIPDDRRGFEPVELDERTVQEHGFPSLAAYNSFRFLDHALGYFIDLARQAPYFERTVFVMYGDHGAPSPRATSWEQLGLTHHHVPLVIHVPWQTDRARRVDSVASLVDLLPTCLGLMGLPYTNTTLGRDLLVSRPAAGHFAFIDHGLLTDERLLRIDPLGDEHLYAYRSETALTDLGATLPDETARLRAVYDLLLDTSHYLLYNNGPAEALAAVP